MEDNWQVKIGIFQDQSIPNVEKNAGKCWIEFVYFEKLEEI